MSDSNRKYRVLFVDDERRILTALRSIFRREYEVYTANGGAEALEILKENKVDVVVSDQRMPNMLGNELLAQVHKLYPQTMRVLLTGFMDKEAIIDTINQGQIYRFINKPWKNDDIREIIAEAALASEFEMEALADESALSELDPVKADSQDASSGTDKALNKRANPSLLLMDDDRGTQKGLKDYCATQGSKLYIANDINQVVSALQSHSSIGVLIIKLPVDSSDTLQSISLLKQYRPELITTILATQTDAETIVSLINAGQIFRYLSHPYDPTILEMTLDESFKHHKLLKKKAKLQKRVKVDNRKLTFSDRIKRLFLPFNRETSSAS